jgi:hypothetical protein
MNPKARWPGICLVIAWAIVITSGCATLDYRNIQRDFNTAVMADNVRTAEALGALTSSGADRLYEDIRAKLTGERIAGLDERLRPNAYAIRAVAEWRSGRLAEARDTALTGLKLPNVAGSPRDEMVLGMIPALVIDEELVNQFRRDRGDFSKKLYDERYARDFATAAVTMARVSDKVRPATSESILYYVALQRWRILQNWRIVIAAIKDGADARQDALQDAASRLGTPLVEEIQRIEDLVPPGEPIRKVMETLRLR